MGIDKRREKKKDRSYVLSISLYKRPPVTSNMPHEVSQVHLVYQS